MVLEHHAAGARAASPDGRAIGQPAGETTLARLGIAIGQPAPGLHPQAAAQGADGRAVAGQHHVQQHLAGIGLGRQLPELREQLLNRDAGGRRQVLALADPARRFAGLPVTRPVALVQLQVLLLEIQAAGFDQRLLPVDALAGVAAVNLFLVLPAALIAVVRLFGVDQIGVDEQLPQAAQRRLKSIGQRFAADQPLPVEAQQFAAASRLPGQRQRRLASNCRTAEGGQQD